jgi:hypothetical protein
MILNTSSAGVTALSLTRDGTADPWVAEEDMPNGGSRILIQDTDLFKESYMTTDVDNWLFISNLCTTYRR